MDKNKKKPTKTLKFNVDPETMELIELAAKKRGTNKLKWCVRVLTQEAQREVTG